MTSGKAKREVNTGYEFDPAKAIRHLARVDPTLGKLMKIAGPFHMEIKAMHDPFEALARNIIFQQLHATAATAIHERVTRLATGKRLRPQDILDATDESLRAAGLSAAKSAALKDLAAKTLEGVVPTLAKLKRMDDEQIIERLTTVRGIGRWTAEMLLIFRLGRGDVWPIGDYAIRKGYALVYGLKDQPAPKELQAYGERWRPFRTVASWYLWRALELPPGELPITGGPQ